MTNPSILDSLLTQEKNLVFPFFNEEVAFAIGSALRIRALAQKAPVVIEIRNASRRFYFSALPGSTPENDNWARRKANTVLQCDASSMLVGARLALEGRSQWPDAVLKMKDYSVHGGAFPVRVKDCGVVAVIAVSGLPSREDHDMIICALRDFLGAKHVPVTP
jgi:uncharacterized protein (UPF0303 family)